MLAADTVTAVSSDHEGALALAQAMVQDSDTLVDASFVAVPPSGTPNGTSTGLASFPTSGDTFGILTTGDATFADDPNDSDSTGADLDGSAVRGDTDFDVTILRIDLVAPPETNCLRFDLRFLSEEFPEFVDTTYNDGFIAELDDSTWSTDGSAISAPDNFAFDPAGEVISVNSTGATSMSAEEAVGTTYDGGTQTLRAGAIAFPGPHSLYLSIFDQGDRVYDTAAFIDSIRFVLVDNVETDCREGARFPSNTRPVAVDDEASTDYDTGIVIGVMDNDSDPDGDSIFLSGHGDASHGTVDFTEGGLFYTPTPGITGDDTFTYSIEDSHEATSTGTVTVHVFAPGEPTPPRPRRPRRQPRRPRRRRRRRRRPRPRRPRRRRQPQPQPRHPRPRRRRRPRPRRHRPRRRPRPRPRRRRPPRRRRQLRPSQRRRPSGRAPTWARSS